MFQSTHPHRVRPGLAVCCDSYIMFQSTHPHRVRLSTPMRKPRRLSFQSTHPHRVRLVSAAIYSAAPCFNPRTHIGCDLQYSSDLFVGTFQSTHPHRVRRICKVLQVLMLGFNPRTHIGCDRVFSKCLNITLQSYNFCGSLQNNTIKTLIFL